MPHATLFDPYDEMPYRCVPIEWTAPERLALASLLHGGPRASLRRYRLLELGCGDASNLLPMAYFRRDSSFVGIDGSRVNVEAAHRLQQHADIANLQVLHADLRDADDRLTGQFDYIVAHGVFSWVERETRDALLALCEKRLALGGLLYLNYNCQPGWSVRGLVRRFLLAQTQDEFGLAARARRAQTVAAEMAGAMQRSAEAESHPYAALMAREFTFIDEHDASYIAHEYLAEHNEAYWRSDFLALMAQHGFAHVADADFNYGSGRLHEDTSEWLALRGFAAGAIEDSIDLMNYRQLHSPILTQRLWTRRDATPAELAELRAASCCKPLGEGSMMLLHPSGYEVEARDPVMWQALVRLHSIWPGSLPLQELFIVVPEALPDLLLLQRNGLIELRCVEPAAVDESALAALEAPRGYVTTRYHTRISPPGSD